MLETIKSKINFDFNFNWKAILIVAVVLILAIAGVAIYKEQTKVIPEELLSETLEKTLAVESYSYRVNLSINTNGAERELTNITGVKASSTDFRIQGKMYGSDVDIYQFEDYTYQKDFNSDKWMEFPNTATDMKIMMAEIDPMVNFDFSQISQVEYLGIEKSDEGKKYVLNLKPEVNNQFLEIYWKDFNYKLWIDKKTKYVTQAEIIAKSKQNPNDSLSFKINLWDFNKGFKLEKPN